MDTLNNTIEYWKYAKSKMQVFLSQKGNCEEMLC